MEQNFCTLCSNSHEEDYCNMDFAPEELQRVKEDYIKKGQLNKCPFCLAVPEGDPYNEIDINTITKSFQCMECGALWHVNYKISDIHIIKVPSRLTLCGQHDKLIFDAIDKLKEYGDTLIAERLHKLFTGGFRHAMV